jgi:5-formyltetrahydrofolate cyclo-ligase
VSVEVQKTLRSLITHKRKELSPEEVVKKSQEAVSHFLSLFDWKKKDGSPLCVGLYRPLPSELDLAYLEREFRAKGHRLVFPKVGPDRSMEFLEVPQSDSPRFWSIGAYGVQEPDASLPNVAPDALDLVFVPGVGFGKNGQRIGRGAGYYDRYLARAPRALRIALGFDFQYVESDFEVQSWDQPVHWLVTESREFRFPGFSEHLSPLPHSQDGRVRK